MRMRSRPLLAAALAATGVLPLAGSASAADKAPHLTALKAGNIVVGSAACHDVPITARFDDAGQRVDGISVKIFHGGEEVGFVTARPGEGASRATTTVRWCKGSPLGRYVAGPSSITYHDPDRSGTNSVDDARTTAFHVRRAARIKVPAADVEGGSADVSARLRAYSPDAGHFTGVRGVTVALQTKRAGGHWTTVDTAVTAAHGAAHLAADGKRFWRVRSHVTETIARATSVVFD